MRAKERRERARERAIERESDRERERESKGEREREVARARDRARERDQGGAMLEHLRFPDCPGARVLLLHPQSRVDRETRESERTSERVRESDTERETERERESDSGMATATRGTKIRTIVSLSPPYRGTSLIRNRAPLGLYSRTMPRARWKS